MNIFCRRRLISFLFILFLISVSSCRFKVPTAGEGEHMMTTKTFRGGVPSWVMQPKSAPRQPVETSGFMPRTLAAPVAVEVTGLAVPNPSVETSLRAKDNVENEVGNASAARDKAKAGSAGAAPAAEKEKDSPLDRVLRICPGVEDSVTDALQTSERRARVSKYEKLTARCPGSADLWIWLGKDYEAENKLTEAGRCYERALTIDHGNEVAQALLSNVRKRQNQKAAPK